MGEVVAACAAGMLDRKDAFELLLRRARIAERAARGGAMASVGLSHDDVQPLVAAAGGRVAIAAVNGPRSTVVAGDGDAVERVLAAAAGSGARTRRLPVRYAFHSPLLDGAGAELAAAVSGLRARDAGVPLYSTVTGEVVPRARLDAAHWGRNLADAVLLRPAVTAMARDGITAFVEVGPHPVLLRDIGATLEETGRHHVTVGSLRRDRPATAGLHRSLGDLYVAGVDPRWDGVLAAPPSPVPLPSYPWQRRRRWLAAVPEVPGAGTTLRTVSGQPALAAVEPPAPEVADAPAPDRVEALTLYVRERVAEAAGLESVSDVPADLPLQSAGLNSLAIVELKNQVEREMRIAVPLVAFLEGGTPHDLARVLATAPAHTDTPAAPDLDAAVIALPKRSTVTRLSPQVPPGEVTDWRYHNEV
jgi:acyl transferase domain-containing protein